MYSIIFVFLQKFSPKMQKKKSKKKVHKITFQPSETAYRQIRQYAVSHNITNGIAVKRLLRISLQQLDKQAKEDVAKNQLGLFDSVQLDIFGDTSK